MLSVGAPQPLPWCYTSLKQGAVPGYNLGEASMKAYLSG